MTYEKIVSYVQKALAKKDFSKVEDVALQVDVYGEGEGAFYVEVKNGKVEVAPYEYYNNTAKLVISADELVAAVDGKATNAAFQIEGDVEKISALMNVITAKAAAKKAPAKKAAPAAKKTPAKKAAAPAAKKAAPAAKKEAPKKAAPAVKKEAPKAAAPAAKKEAPKKAAPVAKKEAPKAAPVAKKEAPKAAEKKATPVKAATPAKTTK